MYNWMSDNLQKYDELNYLIYFGEFEKIKEEIEKIEASSNLSFIDEMEISNLKIKIHTISSNYSSALQLCDKMYEDCIINDNSFYRICAINGRLESYEPLNRIDDCFELINEGEKIFEKDLKSNNPQILAIKAEFYRISGCIYQKAYKLDIALTFLNKTFKIREEIGDKMGIAEVLHHIGVVYHLRTKYDEAIRHFDKSLEYSTLFKVNIHSAWALAHKAWAIFQSGKTDGVFECGNQSLKIAKKFNNIHCEDFASTILGNYFITIGDFNLALKFLENSYKLRKIRNNKLEIAYVLHSIAMVYSHKGEFSLSYQYLQKILKIPEAMKDPTAAPLFLSANGKLLAEQGDYIKAIESVEKAASLFKTTNEIIYHSRCYHTLILISLNQDLLEKAELYLAEIKNLSHQNKNNKYIAQLTRLDEGIILRNNKRLKEKIKAQKIFHQIINDGLIHIEITIEAMLNLIELLIYELELTGDETILTEVTELSDKLLIIAKEQNSYSLQCETLLFKSKLSLIGMDITQTRKLLIESQKIAEEKGLKRLAKKISNEHDFLLSQMNNWEHLVERKIPLDERIKYARYEFLFSKMVRNINEINQKSREIIESPVFLVIWASSGLDLFSLVFEKEKLNIDKKFIAGFLSLFKSFGTQVLSESIHRIKHDNNTIIFQSKGNLNFSYGFKGYSYKAIKKLAIFIESLEFLTDVWEDLKKAELSGENITSISVEKIHSLITSVFLEVGESYNQKTKGNNPKK